MKNVTVKKPPELNLLIHEPARLSIMATLAEVVAADFMFLAGITSLTRGNLSTHLNKLVDAGYVSETKEFVNQKPRSEYRITPEGRAAYQQYLADWARLTGRK
ncbi:MAG TPA: transcriptional regulator [Planctomycetota bacterium]|nr:transcriptional regulator [Planctomycetota bacterium]